MEVMGERFLPLGRVASWMKALRGQPARELVGSAVLHLLVIVLLVHARRPWVAPVRMPGRANGTRVLLTYSPGRASLKERQTVKSPKVIPAKQRLPKIKVEERRPAPPVVAAPSPASANPDSNTGNDGLGTGDVNIALLTYFPVPKPDLTQLPHGTRGDVVIDVVIDATGRIVQATMAKGLGHGVDEAVLATVQQWTFHPATRDGRPVASEQELLFHYERS